MWIIHLKMNFLHLIQILMEHIILLSAIKDFHQKQNSILLDRLKCLEKSERHLKMKKHHFHPRSAYGISKVTGHDLARNYREAYNLYCCTGILFNHSLP